MDADIAAFTHLPPPPYPGNDIEAGRYDLTPTPQSVNRPRLPEEKRNPYLRNLPEDVTIVKFQTIVREGKEIVVGRIKVPTPGVNSHAFILRRYDTDAISLTTMYKVAFPGASEDDEKREMDWVRSSYDTSSTNGGRGFDAVRLAGQWVSRHLAIHLAPAYGIIDLVTALARAVPDPNVAYRKSQRSQAASDEIARAKVTETVRQNAPAVPSMSAETASPAPKRLRRGTPEVGSNPLTRSRARASAEPTSPTSDSGDRHLTLEATTTVTAPAGAHVDMEAEIASAKQLVLDLKRELRLRSAVGEELEDTGHVTAESSSSRGTKRVKGADEAVFISSGAGKTERVVRTNKRIEKGTVAETAKRVAWGAVLFGLGVGAASLLPQFASAFF